MLELHVFVMCVCLQAVITSAHSREEGPDIKEMAKQLKALQTEVTDLKHKVHNLETNKGTRRSKRYLLTDNLEMGPVAFSAYVSNYLYGLAEHKIVTFDGVLLNEGSGYNNHTGVFTSPVSGVYLVSFFIADRDINQVLVQLMVDNAVVSSACAETIQSRHIDQGGNVVLMKLNKGQNMWVETVSSANVHIESHTAYRLTTFSAILMYEV